MLSLFFATHHGHFYNTAPNCRSFHHIAEHHGSVFCRYKCSITGKFLPISRPRLSPSIYPGRCGDFGRFSSFERLFGSHRSALPALCCAVLSAAPSSVVRPPLCLSLSSFCGSAHFPRNVTPNSTSSPAPSS